MMPVKWRVRVSRRVAENLQSASDAVFKKCTKGRNTLSLIGGKGS